MKVVLLLCLATLVYVEARSTWQTVNTFQYVLLKRKEVMESHKRGLGNQARSRCPLSRYHETFQPEKIESGYSTRAITGALNVMRDIGYTEEELSTPTMLAEIKRQTLESDRCRSVTTPNNCDANAKYRTADGTCNNLVNFNWGAANADQIRLLDPAYDDNDDLTSIRSKSSDGSLLVSPRTVSNEIFKGPRGLISKTINLQVFQMAQFVDHDITLTPEVHDVTCCPPDSSQVDSCAPIVVQNNETPKTFFTEDYCMDVRRSEKSSCDSVTRQQRSALSSYLDASNVYGSSQEQQTSLREAGTGKMRVINNRLPPSNDQSCRINDDSGQNCSAAGDHRVNVVPSLAAYHHLWVFEHNRIADRLDSSYNDKEELFQETRRIVIAVMQRIIYGEFLPTFLEDSWRSHFKLDIDEPYEYDETLDATMTNAFGITYRCGHTWIPADMVNFRNDLSTPIEGNRTENSFFNLYLYKQNYRPPIDLPGVDALAMWLSGDGVAETDRVMEEAVRSFLFQDATAQTAFDLGALNVNRGRDHGLPGYIKYRTYCASLRGDTIDLTTWQLLRDQNEIPGNIIDRLEQLYPLPIDIDLFAGAMAETKDGNFGPTVNCIVAEQFHRLKFGDRFFYQNDASPHSFTQEQRENIEEYTMAKVLCNNFDYRLVDRNAFLLDTDRVNCNTLPDLNYGLFAGPNGNGNGNGNGGGGGGSGGGRGPNKKLTDDLADQLAVRELELIEKLLKELKEY